MIEFNKLTIIIPSLLSKIDERWIKQVNRFNQHNIKIIISIPPNLSKKNKFINKFDKEILIINSDKKGQVNQRQYGYKFVKTEYLMHMDDDIFISIKSLKILLNQFENLPRKSFIAPRLSFKYNNNQGLFFKKFINLLLYKKLTPKPGTLLKSTFEVPYNLPFDLNQEIESVDYIPGGISLTCIENILKKGYFSFEGKAYCEDLIHSNLLKKNGVQLFISNKSFYKTEIQNYKDLKTKDFIKFIKNDYKVRNYYRKSINNPLIPFLITYFLLIINFFMRKLIINCFNYRK